MKAKNLDSRIKSQLFKESLENLKTPQKELFGILLEFLKVVLRIYLLLNHILTQASQKRNRYWSHRLINWENRLRKQSMSKKILQGMSLKKFRLGHLSKTPPTVTKIVIHLIQKFLKRIFILVVTLLVKVKDRLQEQQRFNVQGMGLTI